MMSDRDDLVQQLLELDSDIEAAVHRQQLEQATEFRSAAHEPGHAMRYIAQLKQYREQLAKQIASLSDDDAL